VPTRSWSLGLLDWHGNWQDETRIFMAESALHEAIAGMLYFFGYKLSCTVAGLVI